MKDFLNIVYLIVGVSACFFLFLLLQSDQKITEEAEAKNYGWCGTTAFQASSTYGDAREGKILFRNYCAMCHDKSMKKEMTGPALSGSLNRWNRDTTQLQLYFSDSPTYLDSSSNPRLIALKEKWKPTVSHQFRFTMQEVKDIMGYVEGIY